MGGRKAKKCADQIEDLCRPSLVAGGANAVYTVYDSDTFTLIVNGTSYSVNYGTGGRAPGRPARCCE